MQAQAGSGVVLKLDVDVGVLGLQVDRVATDGAAIVAGSRVGVVTPLEVDFPVVDKRQLLVYFPVEFDAQALINDGLSFGIITDFADVIIGSLKVVGRRHELVETTELGLQRERRCRHQRDHSNRHHPFDCFVHNLPPLG